MKKYLASLSVLFMTVFLAGCSSGSAPADPNDPAVAMKKPSSFLKSVDGGKTWEFKNDQSKKINMDAMDVLSMSINPYNGQNIFVGTLNNGILKTEDGGENWAGVGLPVEKVYGIANSYEDGRIIYASGALEGRGKIFKSLDGGVIWSEIYTAPSDGPLVIALKNDRNNPNILLASTSDNQIIKSSDSGMSWKNIYASSSPIVSISTDVANSNIIYIGAQDGNFSVSRDGGASFESPTDNMIGNISLIFADPNNRNWVYVAGRAGFFRSRNEGSSWEELKTLGDPDLFPVKAMAVSPGNSKELIYGAGQAIYKSVDDGGSWMPFQLDTAKNISTIMYDTADPNILYLGLRKK